MLQFTLNLYYSILIIFPHYLIYLINLSKMTKESVSSLSESSVYANNNNKLYYENLASNTFITNDFSSNSSTSISNSPLPSTGKSDPALSSTSSPKKEPGAVLTKDPKYSSLKMEYKSLDDIKFNNNNLKLLNNKINYELLSEIANTREIFSYVEHVCLNRRDTSQSTEIYFLYFYNNLYFKLNHLKLSNILSILNYNFSNKNPKLENYLNQLNELNSLNLVSSLYNNNNIISYNTLKNWIKRITSNNFEFKKKRDSKTNKDLEEKYGRYFTDNFSNPGSLNIEYMNTLQAFTQQQYDFDNDLDLDMDKLLYKLYDLTSSEMKFTQLDSHLFDKENNNHLMNQNNFYCLTNCNFTNNNNHLLNNSLTQRSQHYSLVNPFSSNAISSVSGGIFSNSTLTNPDLSSFNANGPSASNSTNSNFSSTNSLPQLVSLSVNPYTGPQVENNFYPGYTNITDSSTSTANFYTNNINDTSSINSSNNNNSNFNINGNSNKNNSEVATVTSFGSSITSNTTNNSIMHPTFSISNPTILINFKLDSNNQVPVSSRPISLHPVVSISNECCRKLLFDQDIENSISKKMREDFY